MIVKKGKIIRVQIKSADTANPYNANGPKFIFNLIKIIDIADEKNRQIKTNNKIVDPC